MKKYKFIFAILVILFKTGNVLSDTSIFTVNNILINKNAYNNKEELINIAFLRGFKKLNNKILLEKDLIKTTDENLANIKNLISHYQILDNNQSSKEGDTIVNIFFKRDKIYNYYYKNDIKYSDITQKSLKILPVLNINGEIFIYDNNFFYKNWEINEQEKKNNEIEFYNLIDYILPLEDLKVIELLKKNSNNLESLDLSKLFDEYKNKDNLFIVINYGKKNTKVFLKGYISSKMIIKNINLKDKNILEYQNILIALKKEIFEIIKSQNIVDVSRPSFLNLGLKINRENDLIKLQTLLNEIDLIENFHVNELNNRFANIKIKYYGKTNVISEKIKDKGLRLEIENNQWKVSVK
tara:strand:+ start:2125 stop:3183 length:1059 start_codon:yes stop_codon:yes gene_type:complete